VRRALLLGEREREAVRELFAGIEQDVELVLELGPSSEAVTVIGGRRELEPGEETARLVQELVELSDRVRVRVVEHDELGRYPTLAIGDGLRYHGLPWGYELSSLVYGIAEAGRTDRELANATREALARLERDVALEVYVTPT
jgi:alkyl hydroperoxide reductase subunit AhpF